MVEPRVLQYKLQEPILLLGKVCFFKSLLNVKYCALKICSSYFFCKYLIFILTIKF